jgi:hypothetical protein
MVFDRRDALRFGVGVAAAVTFSETGAAQSDASIRTPSAIYKVSPRKPTIKPYGPAIATPRGSFVLSFARLGVDWERYGPPRGCASAATLC